VQLPMTMYYENQAAIHIASSLVFHEWTKQIEVDCHLESVESSVIATPYLYMSSSCCYFYVTFVQDSFQFVM
jgi:hypothetical protein